MKILLLKLTFDKFFFFKISDFFNGFLILRFFELFKWQTNPTNKAFLFPFILFRIPFKLIKYGKLKNLRF